MVTSSPRERTDTTAASADMLRLEMENALRVAVQPLRVAFLTRMLHAATQLARDLDEHALGRAAGASSAYGVMLSALREPEALSVLEQDDPLAAARLRGLALRVEILQAEGGVLAAEQVARVLRLTRQGVDRRRRAGRLLALQTGRHGYAYPAWQFTDDGVLPGLERTLATLTVRQPWIQAAFFLKSSLYLDGASPLEALRRGLVDDTIRSAAAYGEQGAA